MKNLSGFTRIIIVFLVVIALGFIVFESRKNSGDNSSVVSSLTNIITNKTPVPTPFLFEEMTIPYLRSREYKSSLGELKEYSKNASFTSYLTSYNSDNLNINGLLTIPTGPKPEGGFPAIVFVHGYIAPTIYRTTERYTDYVNYLARNGFVVFKIDLRGHGSSEGEPGGAYYSSDYVIDTLNAHKALENADFVNKNKIGLWGHSMAGNVTMRVFTVRPDIPAAVIWAGAGFTYEDLQQYRISDNSYRPPQKNTERARRRQMLFDTYGQFSMESPFWSRVAATNYLKDIKGAIELHHATDDNVVSVDYSRNLTELLDKTSVTHQLFEYQTGGHNLEGSSFNTAMQRSVEFFKKYLK